MAAPLSVAFFKNSLAIFESSRKTGEQTKVLASDLKRGTN
jgi:hypothetical protein